MLSNYHNWDLDSVMTGRHCSLFLFQQKNMRVCKQALLISAFKNYMPTFLHNLSSACEINSANSSSFGKKQAEINWGNGFLE